MEDNRHFRHRAGQRQVKMGGMAMVMMMMEFAQTAYKKNKPRS
jgi:hypothetical protein